jgi:hypothetical protein
MLEALHALREKIAAAIDYVRDGDVVTAEDHLVGAVRHVDELIAGAEAAPSAAAPAVEPDTFEPAYEGHTPLTPEQEAEAAKS